ncbi:hypothetical protein ABZS83_05250 [Streptomyces sp. NPDC005426]|uniref:hypothetical protein n=1 Tax=Streptomyces sp. NPDC005426 TaxID=3155344 RepID=UPI0033BDC6AE
MKIRMLVAMTGTRDGVPWPAEGEEADLPTAAAAHLVSAGVAEEVTAKAVAPEAAAEDKPVRKGGRRAAGSDS